MRRTVLRPWARDWELERSKGVGEAGVFPMRGEMQQEKAGEVQGLKHVSGILDNTECVRQ